MKVLTKDVRRNHAEAETATRHPDSLPLIILPLTHELVAIFQQKFLIFQQEGFYDGRAEP
jgi:hypothetical protein